MNAFKHMTSFEVAASAGILALIGDFIWLVHDIIQNGFEITYAVVATGLLIGITVTGRAWVTHHHRIIRLRRQRKKDHKDLMKIKKELHIK